MVVYASTIVFAVIVTGSSEGKKFMKSRQPVLPSDYFIKAYFASYTQDPVTKDLAAVASAEPILLR